MIDLRLVSYTETKHARIPAPRWLLWITLAISAVLHASFGFMVDQVLSAPAIDIAFQLPMDVELGLSEELALADPAPAAPPPVPEPQAAPSVPGEGEKKPKKPAEPDAGALVKHVPDGGAQPSDAGLPKDAGEALGKDRVGTRLPPGAQIAVRVDMARIRSSPLSEDIRAFLAAIPDWKALLDGSGISPVDKLDRLLIATPDLKRAKVVLAGRFVGDARLAEDAVAKLAAAAGKKAPWHPEGGVRVARWYSADDTPRVIALVGPQHFTISRVDDLPRVLAIAAARAADRAADAGPIELPADALLSMEENEGLSLEVDGVEQFIKRAPRGVPMKLRIAAVEVPGPAISVRARLVFLDSEKAADALRFWEAVRKSYSRNALIVLMGMAAPLREAVLELKDRELTIRVELSVAQTRLILGYVRELLSPPAPMPSSIPSAPPLAPIQQKSP